MSFPRKVGPFTLMRKLTADAVAESFVAILDAPAGKQVVVRRILPAVGREAARLQSLRTRAGDLRSLRAHPDLARVLGVEEVDGELFVVEEQPEGVELATLVGAVAAGRPVPHNVFLHLAAQLCNALEALHANPGIETGSEHVLHLALSPNTVWVTPDGRLTLGRYGLTRSPTSLATQATGTSLPSSIEYLSPEQTHQDQKLTPASDLFSLGAVLYEVLTGRSLFRAETNLQTIHRLRRAEVTTQLLDVKEVLPGLDKVLFRSLSLNPRHRYQRAFVLREDLRGLMANYSFSDIDVLTRDYLEPALATAPLTNRPLDGSALGAQYQSYSVRESTVDLLRGVPDEIGLDDSPTSEPREFEPLNLHHDVEARSGDPGPGYATDADSDAHYGPEGTEPGADDTGALLRGDTGTVPRPEDLPGSDDTAWSPNARRALQEGMGTRPLQAIDTARQRRLDPEPRRPVEDLPPLQFPDLHGDTLPMALETTRPSPDDSDHTGPSGWHQAAHRVPALGPPSLPPEPSIPSRTPAPAPSRAGASNRPPTGPIPAPAPFLTPPEPRSGELNSADLVSAELNSGDLGRNASGIAVDPAQNPPSQAVEAPFDFAASLAEDTGLHPLRNAPRGALDLRSPPAGPAHGRLGAPDSLSAPGTPPAITARLDRVAPPSLDPNDAPPQRSLLWPAVGLGLVTVVAAIGVFLCVGGGGVLGLLGLRSTQVDPPVVALRDADPETNPRPGPTPDPSPEAPPPRPEIAAVEPTAHDPALPNPVAEPVVVERDAVAPEPPPRAAPPTPRQRQLNVELTPPRPTPPRETFDAVQAAAPSPRPAPPPPAPSEAPVARPPESVVSGTELDEVSADAFAGHLPDPSRARLAAVPVDAAEFTRAQTLLFLDAKARGDDTSRDRAMGALMALPENRYSPALLVEQSQIQLERRQWQAALDTSRKAEQHWARLPSDLVWSRKAMMYELQALANTGLFYDSEGDDLNALRAAIRDWERYDRHAATKGRKDLQDRAAEQLAGLRQTESRLAGGAP